MLILLIIIIFKNNSSIPHITFAHITIFCIFTDIFNDPRVTISVWEIKK